MNKLHPVNLSSQQKQELLDILKQASFNTRVIRLAHTLLMASEGKTDRIVSKTLKISVATVERTRKQFCQEDLTTTLQRLSS
ncbi:MAG: helix-turn-helix domain-containing protein [Microcoleaceae cyanobacterium]